MRIKLVSVVLTAVVSFSVLAGAPAQAATPKAGAACSKTGIIQVVKSGAKSTKFTCVKSGKKLSWNKGVVTVAKPKATPVPAPTAIPVITLDNLDAAWTSKVALSKIQEKLATLPETNFEPEIITSPTTKSAEVELELKLLKPAIKLFQKEFLPAKFQVVMFTNEDGQWAKQALTSYGGSFPFDLGEEIARRSSGNKRCNFAFATVAPNRMPIYYECTDTRQLRDGFSYQTPPHEYFHLVHQALAPVRLPVWLTEGSASFFGEMLGYGGFANTAERKLQQGFNTGYDFDPDGLGFDPKRFENWLRTAKSAEVSNIFKILETEPTRARRFYAEYALGSWATEALVAVYGVDGFMKLWPLLGSGQSFDMAFKNTFGLTPDEFYVKLTPYLNSRVNPKL
jgi:hypothetical protein